jgi:hypothetical protein
MFNNQLRSPEMVIRLIINNVEVKLKGYDSIKDLTQQLPDKEGYEAIYHELAKLPSADVREVVAWKDNLGEDTVKLLLDDSSPTVLERIIRNDKFPKFADKEMLIKILNTQLKDVLENLADNVEEFNEGIRDWLCNELLKQKDPGIRMKLARNQDVPLNILGELAKDDDEDVATKAKESLERKIGLL